MKMLCLMPTYGRRPALLENAIQLFLNQDHPDKTLLIFDDLGTLSTFHCDIPNVVIMSTMHREPSIGAKYNKMMNLTDDYDVVVVWDDDDVYLPHHLSAHEAILIDYPWSKPSRILSAFHTPLAEEAANGRFHGSIAIRTDYVKEVGGWIDTKRATFDQEMLQRLHNNSLPGDTLEAGPISYVYRWQTSGGGHCSGGMGDPDWYAKYQPDHNQPINHLTPQFDEDTATILHNLT